MKISYKEILSKKEWLHSVILSSNLPDEVYEKTKGDDFFDVKLVINGIELEPKFLNDLMNNIEKYVDIEARSLIRDKLSEVDNKAEKLRHMIDKATSFLIDEYCLDTDND